MSKGANVFIDAVMFVTHAILVLLVLRFIVGRFQHRPADPQLEAVWTSLEAGRPPQPDLALAARLEADHR